MTELAFVYKIVVFAVLCINAICDFRKREVISLLFLLAAASGFFLGGNVVLCALTIVSVLVFKGIPGINIGGGDLDAILLVFSAMRVKGVFALLIACVAAIIFYFASGRKKEIPFVFCLGIGYFIVFWAIIFGFL